MTYKAVNPKISEIMEAKVKKCSTCKEELPMGRKSYYCKSCHNKMNREYKRTHLEKTKEYRKRSDIRNKGRINATRRIYMAENREELKKYQKEYKRKVKKIIFDHYGNICVCCGETEPQFLTIDHVNGGGYKHRKEIKANSGISFYDWLRRNQFPVDFQTLCINCNFAKGHYGNTQCPHKFRCPELTREAIKKAVREETVREIEGSLPKNYTFKQVDWGEGITSTEPVENTSISLQEAKGFNSALSSIREAINKLKNLN